MLYSFKYKIVSNQFVCLPGKAKQLEEKMLQKLEEDVVMAEDNIDPTA